MSGHDPFCHLPALRGCVVPAAQSALRADAQRVAQWDAQAALQGLPADWRWCDARLEASCRMALGAWQHPVDVWVFGYGSLMWDPAIHFSELRRACLRGHARRFSYRTILGRGTPEQPALTLALEPGQPEDCEGLAFRIPAACAADELLLLWRREMLRGGYRPACLPVHTPQGLVNAWTFLSNPAHDGHVGVLPLDETATVIARAVGNIGRNSDYLWQLHRQLQRLGVADAYVHQLWQAVRGRLPAGVAGADPG